MDIPSPTPLPPPSSPNPLALLKSNVLVILLTVLVMVCAGAGVFFYLQEKEQINQLNTQVAQLSCKGTWQNGQCQIPVLRLLAPVGGESICTNTTYQIKWEAPSDMKTIDIWLQKATRTSYPIELGVTAYTTNGVGGSPYNWDIASTVKKFTYSADNIMDSIKPGDKYIIMITGSYNGAPVTDESKYLTLQSCEG